MKHLHGLEKRSYRSRTYMYHCSLRSNNIDKVEWHFYWDVLDKSGESNDKREWISMFTPSYHTEVAEKCSQALRLGRHTLNSGLLFLVKRPVTLLKIVRPRLWPRRCHRHCSKVYVGFTHFFVVVISPRAVIQYDNTAAFQFLLWMKIVWKFLSTTVTEEIVHHILTCFQCTYV